MQSPLAADAPTSAATPLEALVIPDVGQPWPDQGGIYAGICRDDDGTPPHHLIWCPAFAYANVTWAEAISLPTAFKHEGHADYKAPTRRQGAQLYATLYDLLPTDDWCWLLTEYSERNAWFQYFHGGHQGRNGKSSKARAVAVRRLPLQSFNPLAQA